MTPTGPINITGTAYPERGGFRVTVVLNTPVWRREGTSACSTPDGLPEAIGLAAHFAWTGDESRRSAREESR